MRSLRTIASRILLATGRAAPDLLPRHLEIIRRVKPYTRTSRERVAALLSALDYLKAAGIPGDVVECGVWQGGSMMAAAIRLLDHVDRDRIIWLYDTFEGMSQPTDKDTSVTGGPARVGGDRASLKLVQHNLESTGWPPERTRYVRGKVEDTLPASLPERVALLRLDTDWYESTRHELENLYPLVAPGGILIVDDYGHWKGARQATDEYFSRRPVYLHRIDYAGRLVVKTSGP